MHRLKGVTTPNSLECRGALSELVVTAVLPGGLFVTSGASAFLVRNLAGEVGVPTVTVFRGAPTVRGLGHPVFVDLGDAAQTAFGAFGGEARGDALTAGQQQICSMHRRSRPETASKPPGAGQGTCSGVLLGDPLLGGPLFDWWPWRWQSPRLDSKSPVTE